MKSSLGLVTFAFVFACAVPALAQVQGDNVGLQEPNPPDSYWSTVFQGGVLTPLGEMEPNHQRSLAGGGRIGWTSGIGLGVDMAAEYSPLSRKNSPAGEIYEAHFVTASLMPRYTLGKKKLRLWFAAGGGVAFERSTLTATMGTNFDGTTSNKYAPAGVGAAGFEFHMIPGMGLALISSYTRTYGDLQYQMVNITGGFSFTFR